MHLCTGLWSQETRASGFLLNDPPAKVTTALISILIGLFCLFCSLWKWNPACVHFRIWLWFNAPTAYWEHKPHLLQAASPDAWTHAPSPSQSEDPAPTHPSLCTLGQLWASWRQAGLVYKVCCLARNRNSLSLICLAPTPHLLTCCFSHQAVNSRRVGTGSCSKWFYGALLCQVRHFFVFCESHLI